MRSFKIKDGKASSIKDDKASTTTLSAPCATSPCTGEAKKNTPKSCTGEAKKDNLKSCAGEAKKNNLKQKYYALRKYAIIVLCLLATVCMSVGFSKWNIHLKRTLTTDDGNGFFNYAPSYNAATGNETSVLERYLCITQGDSSFSLSDKIDPNTDKVSLTYDGNSVALIVVDTDNTADEVGDGTITKWSEWQTSGLEFTCKYYQVTDSVYSSIADSDETPPVDAGNYVCFVVATASNTATTEIKNLQARLNEKTVTIDDSAISYAARVEFTVNPQPIACVSIAVQVDYQKNQSGNYTYNGNAYAFKLTGYDKDKMSCTTSNNLTVQEDENYYTVSSTDAGTYSLTFSLNKNYVWKNGDNADTNADLNFTWTIDKAEITKPTLAQSEFEYSGESIDITSKLSGYDSGIMSIKVNAATNVGSYNAKVAIQDDYFKNYKWLGSDDQSFTIPWSIKTVDLTISVEQPITISKGTEFTQDLFKDKYTIEGLCKADKGKVSVTFACDSYSQTNAGNYEVSVTITGNNANNYNVIIKPTTIYLTVTAGPKKPTKNDTTLTYDGTSQDLTQLLDDFDSATMTVKNNLQKNAGTYDINITANDGTWSDGTTDPITISDLKIEKKPISTCIVELDYSSSLLTWKAVEEKLRTLVGQDDVYSGDTITITTGTLTNGFITYSYNGTTYTGTVDTSYGADMGLTNTYLTQHFVGSTYQGSNLTIDGSSASNYDVSNTIYYLKYKTTLIGSTLYTIEDAIAERSSSTITFKGTLSNTAYVTTTFSKFTNKDYKGLENYSSQYTVSGRTLLVPFENSTSELKEGEEVYRDFQTYSALIVPSGITINFKSNAKLYVGGYITGAYDAAYVSHHGVLINDGAINIGSACQLYSYGFIKSSSENSEGIINLAQSSKAKEFMQIHDFPGGTATSSMYNKYFPINAWSIHNNACKTKITAGAQYYVYTAVHTSKQEILGWTIGGYTSADDVCIIGKAADSNCMFLPQTDNTNSYIVKSATSATLWKSDTTTYKDQYNQLYTIIGDNCRTGQKDYLEIHGEYIDKTLSMDVGAEMKTSTSISLPLGYMDVTVSSQSTLTLSNSSYMFLPGTKLIIDDQAKLIVGSKVQLDFLDYDTVKSYENDTYAFYAKCIDKGDSYAIVNGTLQVSGQVGGLLKSQKADAVLQFASAQSGAQYTLKYTTDSPYGVTAKLLPKGTQIDSGADADFATESTGYYLSTLGTDGNYYWSLADNICMITLNQNDGSGQTNVWVKIKGYVLTEDDLQAPSTTKDLVFVGWYLDANFSTQVTAGYQITDNLSLYAKWRGDIVYNGYKFPDGTSASVNEDDLPKTYVYGQELSLTTPTCDDSSLSFGGWFLDSACKQSIKTIAAGTDTTITLYGLWTKETPTDFDVTLSSGRTDVDLSKTIWSFGGTVESGVNGQTLTLNATWKNNTAQLDGDFMNSDDFATIQSQSHYNFDSYFVGWRLTWDGNTTGQLFQGNTITITADQCAENPVLTAEWATKAILHIEFFYNNSALTLNGVTSLTKYFKPGLEVNKEIVTTICNAYGEDDCYTLTKYTSNNLDNPSIEFPATSGSTVNINAIYDKKSFAINKGTHSNASITINQTSAKWGETVSFTVTFTYDNSKKVTVLDENGDTVTTTSSGTTYSFTMPKSAVTITASSEDSCVAMGTLITLADGRKKKVEDLTNNDLLLTFDHETGTYKFAKLLVNEHIGAPMDYYSVINLKFSSGSVVKIIRQHGFFDLTLNKYVYINEFNYNNYVGHKFYAADYNGKDYRGLIVTLDQVVITKEYTAIYNPMTQYGYNLFTEDILSVTTGLQDSLNVFTFDENMKYDEVLKQRDIETYGLFKYEDFKDYMSEDIFEKVVFKYYKVAIAKGLITMDYIEDIMLRYVPLVKSFESSSDVLNDGSDSGGAEDNSSVPAAQEAAIIPSSSSSKTKSSSDTSSDDDTL